MTDALRRSYDHRLRLVIAESGDPHLFRDIDNPSSTRRSWTTRRSPSVVALHPTDREFVELQVALAQVEAANRKLRAIIKLLPSWVSVLGGRLRDRRVPDGSDKARLLAMVRRVEPVLGRAQALRVLGVTPARLREWKRRELRCELDDAPTCPKRTPQQLN